LVSKLIAFAERFFDSLDFMTDGFELAGGNIVDIPFGVDQVEAESRAFLEPKIKHAGAAALATTRETHARFSQAASAFDHRPLLGAVSQFELKTAIRFVIRDLGELPGKKRLLIVLPKSRAR
jgi:hypothetical protein